MRVKVTKTKCYTAAELRRKRDKAPFERALEKYREHLDLSYTSDEMMDSLKGLFEAAGVKMRDWSLGAYDRGNMLRAEFSQEGTEDLTGARALAWIENRILGPLRAPWGFPSNARRGLPAPRGYSRPFLYRKGAVVERKTGALSRYTKPGAVPECPFTGVCYDMDFLEDLIKSVRAGRTLKEAFEDLADLFARQLEDEYEYQGKEEQFLEAAGANAWEFDEDGDMV